MEEDTLLTALREQHGTYVSGEELSRRSGVSRAAVWKQIEKLRDEGYQIAAQPHLGYRFIAAPDRLIAEELQWRLATKVIGRKISSYSTTDSTMDLAHRLVASGEPEGHVVVAEAQSQGRGRLGRTWQSPAGQGIYASVILRPKIAPTAAPLLTLLAAVATVEAIHRTTGLAAQIKWPNDVMIRERKVAGILTELTTELNRIRAAILGIGLNVNTPKSALPRFATSLAVEHGQSCDRLTVARALFVALDEWYGAFLRDGGVSLLAAWRHSSMTLGRRVRVVCDGRQVDGEAVDLDGDGALLVRTDAGRVEPVTAGEVLIVR